LMVFLFIAVSIHVYTGGSVTGEISFNRLYLTGTYNRYKGDTFTTTSVVPKPAVA